MKKPLLFVLLISFYAQHITSISSRPKEIRSSLRVNKKKLSNKNKKDKWMLYVVILSSLVGIIIAYIVYYISMISQESVSFSNPQFGGSVHTEIPKPRASINDFLSEDFTLSNLDKGLCYIVKKENSILPFDKFDEKYLIPTSDNTREQIIPQAIYTKDNMRVSKKFKKIHWLSTPSREKANNLLSEGYDLIFIKRDNDSPIIKDAFFIHPQLKDEFIVYLTCIIRDLKKDNIDTSSDMGHLEIGALLSLEIHNVFGFTFGSKITKKAYPNVEWRYEEWDPKPDEDVKNDIILGLNRLKAVFKDKLPYILAGPLPNGDLPGDYESQKYTIEEGWVQIEV